MFLDNPVFHATMHDGAISIVKFLIKRKMLVVAKAMLDNYYDESRLDDNLLAARIALKDGYFSQAEELFAKAYEIENHGEQSLKGYAQASFIVLIMPRPWSSIVVCRNSSRINSSTR